MMTPEIQDFYTTLDKLSRGVKELNSRYFDDLYFAINHLTTEDREILAEDLSIRYQFREMENQIEQDVQQISKFLRVLDRFRENYKHCDIEGCTYRDWKCEC